MCRKENTIIKLSLSLVTIYFIPLSTIYSYCKYIPAEVSSCDTNVTCIEKLIFAGRNFFSFVKKAAANSQVVLRHF